MFREMFFLPGSRGMLGMSPDEETGYFTEQPASENECVGELGSLEPGAHANQQGAQHGAPEAVPYADTGRMPDQIEGHKGQQTRCDLGPLTRGTLELRPVLPQPIEDGHGGYFASSRP